MSTESWELQDSAQGTHVAACQLWTHPMGGEGRLEVDGEWSRGEAGRDGLALLDLALGWKAQSQDKGWKESQTITDCTPMNEDPRRVTLSKEQRGPEAGRELIALLTDLSADGRVTREEMDRLRAWLEVDRGVDFRACGFLYEVVDAIPRAGPISEEELDALAMAIERVLPPDIRLVASLKRKQNRAAKRSQRTELRAEERAAQVAARERAKPLHRTAFIIRGALRSAERRECCEALEVGEAVTLDREPDNTHDANAILVLDAAGTELDYVPREDAGQMALLLDGGADVDATVRRLWETPQGGVVPIVRAVFYRAGQVPAPAAPLPKTPIDSRPLPSAVRVAEPEPVAKARSGPQAHVVILGVILVFLATLGYCAR